jgi:hypothetical protein
MVHKKILKVLNRQADSGHKAVAFGSLFSFDEMKIPSRGQGDAIPRSRLLPVYM